MVSLLQSRFKEDEIMEIGIDEAGRGSFWGPIMAGAVSIPNESEWTMEQRELLLQMRDSKKISAKKRVILAKKLKELIPMCAVGIVHANEINENGITWANMEAFRRAIDGLNGLTVYRLLIDGTLEIDDCKEEQNMIIEGDDKYIAIGAASILAKVSHDEWIKEYCKVHPECDERYHLVKSNGYGTKLHREGIKLYGADELHRVLYVKNWLPMNAKNNAKNNATNNATNNAKNNAKKANDCLITF